MKDEDLMVLLEQKIAIEVEFLKEAITKMEGELRILIERHACRLRELEE